MKRIILFAIPVTLLFSCVNKTTENWADAAPNRIEITNDMEDAALVIPSWMNEKTVIAMKEPAAHSGKYACVTNDTLEYGYGYAER